METKEQRQCRNKTAKSLGRLSIGIFTVSLLGDTQWLTITLIVFGVILALIGVYLIIPGSPKHESFLRERDMDIAEALGWFIVLSLFGLRLIQKGVVWLTIVGILFVIVAYIVFVVSLLRKRSKEGNNG